VQDLPIRAGQYKAEVARAHVHGDTAAIRPGLFVSSAQVRNSISVGPCNTVHVREAVSEMPG